MGLKYQEKYASKGNVIVTPFFGNLGDKLEIDLQQHFLDIEIKK